MRGQAVVPTDAAEAVERLLEDLRIAQGVIAAAQDVVRHGMTSDRYRALKDALTAYEEENKQR